MFVMADEAQTRGMLEQAGFTDIRMEDVPVRFEYRDVDDYVAKAYDTGGMFAKAWDSASEEEREVMLDDFRDAFAPYAVDGGYELPGVSLCVVAS
jgi:hypothetical protein